MGTVKQKFNSRAGEAILHLRGRWKALATLGWTGRNGRADLPRAGCRVHPPPPRRLGRRAYAPPVFARLLGGARDLPWLPAEAEIRGKPEPRSPRRVSMSKGPMRRVEPERPRRRRTGLSAALKAGEPAHAMLTLRSGKGDAAPPFEPPASRAAAGAAGGLGAPPSEPRRRCGCVAVRAAAASDGAERTWTAPALAIERERSRQIGRIGNNLNQLARWAVNYLVGDRDSRSGAPHHPGDPDPDSRIDVPRSRSRDSHSRRCRRLRAESSPVALPNTGRAVGELVDPPPRSVVEHPSRRDCWAGATPRDGGRGVKTHVRPNPYQALGLGGRLSFPFLGMSA